MLSSTTVRPWGTIGWLWPKLPQLEWTFLGCVSAEGRSIAAWRYFVEHTKSTNAGFLRIKDMPSRHFSEVQRLTEGRETELVKLGTPSEGISEHDLFCAAEDIKQRTDEIISSSNGNLVLDISSFPKRFFFPILRFLVSSTKIQSLLVCNTIPDKYGVELAEDPAPWEAIPTYAPVRMPEDPMEIVFLGVGYIPLGFGEILKNELASLKICPLLPVPPFSNRNWSFISSIESGLREGVVEEPIRIDARNASEAFDHMMAISKSGTTTGIVAPFGPKPLSLAMALFTLVSGYSAYYTQPRVYLPDYSTGVADDAGDSLIWTYCIRIEGNDYYS